MSKQAAEGGERPIRRTAPPRDGAGTSAAAAAMAARPPGRASNEYGSFWGAEAAETSVQSVHPGEDDAPAAAAAPPAHGAPWYAPPRKRGAPPPPRQAVDQPSYPYERQGFPDQERGTTPAPVGALRRGPRPPPGSFAPVKQNVGAGHQAAPVVPGGSPEHEQHHDPTYTSPPLHPPPPHHGRHPEWMTTPRVPGKPPTPLPSERRRKRPAAFCFTACCILFWLLVIAAGLAVLVVYLLYHPQPPRLRVEDATLNAGHVDVLPRRRLALSSDLSVLAAISNPNTKVDVVLRYMEMDLYFGGNLLGTAPVWPAPLHQGPGGYALRQVRIVASEVTLSREDAMAWQNATADGGGPVALHLVGRFHAQLNFGRWLPFGYWIYPRCTLWFDPPPSGRLRRVRC